MESAVTKSYHQPRPSRPFPPHHPPHHPLGGILCMMGATGLFAVMDALVKWLSADYPVVQLLFFRNAFALVVIVPLLARAGAEALRTRRPRAHALRSLLGLCALSAFFHALSEMPLAQVTAIGFAAPLVMTALSALLLGERVGPRRWVAVGAGFVGVVVVVDPFGAVLRPAALVAVAGTLLYALMMVTMRFLGRTERSVTTAFYFTVVATALSGLLLPAHWVAPAPGDWPLLAALGLVGGVAQLLITQAVRLAPISTVAPFDYLHLVFATAIGYAIWDHVPSVATLAGAAVIVAAGLYVLRREARPSPAPLDASGRFPPKPNPRAPDNGRGH